MKNSTSPMPISFGISMLSIRRPGQPRRANNLCCSGSPGCPAPASRPWQALERALFEAGFHTYLLDGDNVRHGLCKDLGFSAADRDENLRRVGEVAHLMVDAGLLVLSAFISPTRAERDAIRCRFAAGRFIEVHVSTPLAVCEARDPKGLYQKARKGEIRDFTGISAPYEEPLAAELTIDTSKGDLNTQVQALLDYLSALEVIPSTRLQASA